MVLIPWKVSVDIRHLSSNGSTPSPREPLYAEFFSRPELFRVFLVVSLAGTIVIGTMAAYAINRFGFRAKKLVLFAFLRTISRALDEAALIDGASYFMIYRKIILPLLKPATATVVTIKSVAIYNGFASGATKWFRDRSCPRREPISIVTGKERDAGSARRRGGERGEGRGFVRDQGNETPGSGAGGGRVTLSEVAGLAGVSRAAASLALRGKPGVADGTRQRILEIAEELGYRVRPTAGQGVTGTIGLLVKARQADVGSTNAFYAPVIAGISRACADQELDLRLDSLSVDEHFNPVEVPRMIQAADIDGLIILGAFLSAPSVALVGAQPVVLVDGYAEGGTCLPSVISDNTGGVASATRHLIGLGHRRIAMVGTMPDAFPSILERRRGYTVAMTEAGLDPFYVDGPHDDPALCAQRFSRVLADDPPTAVVAANDAVALTLMSHLELDVPDRISLVGFDDIEASRLVRPGLTTVGVDKEAMGRLAVSLVRHRVAHPDDPVFTVVQQARLILRGSVALPRS
ncbi:MAG: lacI-type protein [Actinomycetota bacterium]|nr:lacI-type protein [Actinomycetota bacterium]